MIYQADTPTIERAVQSTTIQEFIEHGKNIAYKSFGFPSSGDYAYYSPQEIGLLAEKAVCHYHSKGISIRKDAADASLDAEAIQHLAHEANCRIILNSAKDGQNYRSIPIVTLTVQDAEALEALKRCSLVTNLGGVLPPAVARILTQNGVRLTTGYGISELPLSLSSIANAGDPLFWDYLQIAPSVAPHLRFRLLSEKEGNTENGNETFYELIILPSLPAMDKKWANASDGSLHTGDIFVKHPTQESYRCLGRLTDMVRVTPNSTDVIPLHARIYESIIENRCTEIIDAAVLYGDERPSVVILLFVKSSATTLSDERIIDEVWSVIESEAQTVQLVLLVGLKKAMLVIIRDQKIPRTSKGDVIRAQTFLQFSSFIDSVL
ncbi:hypothetical protein ARSEF1564_009555 [Beauveria bassiana]